MSNWWKDFEKSIHNGDDEMIMSKLNKISVKHTYDRKGNNLLHYLAHSDQVNVAKRLILLGCDVNHKNNIGETPFIVAIVKNKKNMTELFLNNGAVLLNNYYKNEKGALHFAASFGHYDIFQMLLEAGCDTKSDENFTSLLHYASLCNSGSSDDRVKLTKLLIVNGFDVNSKCYDGSTPLHFVSAYGKNLYGSDIIINMLIEAGAQLEAENSSRLTPLFWATIHGKTETVMQLLKAGSKIDKTDMYGLTCLSYAIQNLHYDIVEILLNNDVLITNIIELFWKCLHICSVELGCSREFYDECDKIIENRYTSAKVDNQVKCLSLLIEFGADVNSIDSVIRLAKSISAIYKALLLNHSKIVRLLLKNGAIFDYQNKYAQMALKRVNSKASKSMFELIKHTAKTEVQNQNKTLNFELESMKKPLIIFYNKCIQELSLMKKVFIYGGNLSYFNILNRYNIKFYVRNEEVRNTLYSTGAKNLFPIYHSILLECFEDELRRQQLIEKTLTNMCQLFKEFAESNVYIVFSNVCNYLNSSDLRKLIKL